MNIQNLLLFTTFSLSILAQDIPDQEQWKQAVTTKLATDSDRIYHLAYSPDSRIIAASLRSKVILMDSIRGYIAQVLQDEQQDHLCDLAYHPDNNIIAVGTSNGSVLFWSHDDDDDRLLKKKNTLVADRHHIIMHLAFSRDGKTLLTGFDRTVKLFDAQNNLEYRKFDFPEADFMTEQRNPFNDCALHPTEPILAVAFGRAIKLLDTRTCQEIATIPFSDSCFWNIKFHPDGKTLATCATQIDLRKFNDTYPVYKRLETLLSNGPKFDFSPDGQTIAFESRDNTVKLWDVNNQQESSQVLPHNGRIMGLVFSPNNTQLAVADYDRLTLWQDPMTLGCQD